MTLAVHIHEEKRGQRANALPRRHWFGAFGASVGLFIDHA